MKRLLKPLLIIITALFLVSWGSVGHKTIALIAEHHLTPEAKAGVKALLGDESLADVSNWADKVKSDPEYSNTSIWHYVDVPSNLNRHQFDLAVSSQADIAGALLKVIAGANNKSLTIEKRREDLKFLVHLVGDAHQPMHVSSAEDKGGNLILVQFDGRGTNLHSLWDTKLIDHQGLSYEQMAKEYDTASPAQIKEWQSKDFDINDWLWESYQISNKLYNEIETNNKLGEPYYNSHINIVRERIEMAGIRLAGILNSVFSNKIKSRWTTKITLTPPPNNLPTTDSSAVEIELKDLPDMIGKEVVVHGKVYGLKDLGKMTLVDIGAAYPKQLLTVVLKSEAKQHFSNKFIISKTLTIIGLVKSYKGKPEIEISDSNNLSFK